MSATTAKPQGAKKCNCCGEVRSLEQFYLRRNAADGRYNACRDCHRAKARAWRATNPAKKREANRRWRESNRERVSEYTKEWERANPERKAQYRRQHDSRYPAKAQARHAISHAIRDGRLIKPDRCEDCNELTESRLLHGHHEDYSRPLDVNWLCRPCHFKRHAGAAR